MATLALSFLAVLDMHLKAGPQEQKLFPFPETTACTCQLLHLALGTLRQESLLRSRAGLHLLPCTVYP